MFGTVSVQPRSLADYKTLAGERACHEVAQMGKALRGLRVLHLTARGEGTRTAALLRGLVPLFNAVGVAAEWQVVPTTDECRSACDTLYRALVRGQKGWSQAAHAAWLRYADLNAALFDRDFDFVVVHDPQPLAIFSAKVGRARSRPPGRWVWHCHYDLTGVQPDVWGALRPHLINYDAAIYPSHEWVRAEAGVRRVVVIPPVVDPLSPRCIPMEPQQVEAVLRRYALNPARPLLVYVGPMNRETDPIGLMEAFALAKPQVPGLQLALVADTLGEDREARSFAGLVAERARHDEARFLSARNGVGEPEIDALQWGATVAVQRAVGRGYSPGILEAMWKGKPVVAGRDGGLALHVVDVKTGLLAESAEVFGLRLVDLLRNEGSRVAMGAAGRERVRRGMLITRCLRDYLALFQSYS